MESILNLFHKFYDHIRHPSFLPFFTTILVPIATGLGWGLNRWYVNHVHRDANAHCIYRLETFTRIRLAEIDRDRAIEIARLERNGELFYSARLGICSLQVPRLNHKSNACLFSANAWAASTILPLLLYHQSQDV